MTKNGRREFLNRTGLTSLGGAVALNSPPELGQTGPSLPAGPSLNGTASFGWKVSNLNNNGADVYFPVARNMLLNAVNIDAAFVVLSQPVTPFWTELLCRGNIYRGAAPVFGPQGPSYLPFTQSPDFGSVTLYNPNNLNVHADAILKQDFFYSIIMKAWVPLDGTAAAVSRQFSAEPSLTLHAGDYLSFHMDHAGLPGEGEMQIVLAYSVR
jgi:hypothetical protein